MNRTTRISIAFTALLTTLLSAPALAAEPGFYLSASAGHAEENPGKSIGTNIAIGGLFPSGIQHIEPTRVDVDNGDVAWGAAVGYRLNPYFAAEVEYMDFGTANVSEHYNPATPPFPADLTQSYSSKVKGPALSVLGSVPLGKAWDVFLRAGVLFADREINLGRSVSIRGNTFGSTVWLAGAGVEWSVASRWALRAEYQRTGKLDTSFLAGSTELERASLSVLFKL